MCSDFVARGHHPVLEVQDLCKSYIMYPSERRRLVAMLTGKVGDVPSHRALERVNLKVYPGDCVGVVGRNGAGKSTLLQIICGTLKPSSGSVVVNGRISPLLELSSGFCSDFTGRENVYQKASILGLSRKQTKERFDQIVDFADIGEFLDRPVRMYSSGMLARLAFAVSIHVDASILVLDEILAVGDSAFQRKCHARIAQLRSNGTAVLLVSHSTGAITSSCNRAILIDQGQCILSADPKTVVSWYHRLLDVPSESASRVRQEIQEANGHIVEHGQSEDIEVSEASSSASSSADCSAVEEATVRAAFVPEMVSKSVIEWDQRGARIEHVRVEDESGRRVNVLVPQHRYQMVYEVCFHRDVSYARFGMLIRNIEGLDMYGCASSPHSQGYGPVFAHQRYIVRFRFRAALAQSAYFCCAGVLGPEDDAEESEEVYLHRVFDASMFRVQALKSPQTAGYTDLSEYDPKAPYGASLVSIEQSS